MKWIAVDNDANSPTGQVDQSGWRLVDAAEQAAGWLVEPAIAAGRVELLPASLQLSQAADLLVDRERSDRLRVPPPDPDASIDVLCHELLELLTAGRVRLAQECQNADTGGGSDSAARGHAALLVDEAHRTIKETLR